jgi:radical SAM/Cys-rich protein
LCFFYDRYTNQKFKKYKCTTVTACLSGRIAGSSAQKWQSLLPFRDRLAQSGLFPLHPTGIEIFQVNIGKMCNQTCKHCHVDAGPDRKEIMTRETMQQCLDVLATHDMPVVDITGGAPEMNPHFRFFVEECSKLGKKVIVRCNLTIIVANPKYRDLPEFYRKHRVEVVSSLPFYNADRTDRQRGKGVFEDSMKALHLLNEAGYGKEGTGLMLNLVYNPSGAFLPATQQTLEKQFKKVLLEEFGVQFNNLYAITNMPISRFLDFLLQSGNYEDYMEKLVKSYNAQAASGVMCRNTISVSWDGYLYDCDFNQMLDLPVSVSASGHISQFDLHLLNNREIVLKQHCYGCTAGAGSSCGGTTA